MFLNSIWNLFELFRTALMIASGGGYTEVVQLLLKQKLIDINAQDIYFFCSNFI